MNWLRPSAVADILFLTRRENTYECVQYGMSFCSINSVFIQSLQLSLLFDWVFFNKTLHFIVNLNDFFSSGGVFMMANRLKSIIEIPNSISLNAFEKPFEGYLFNINQNGQICHENEWTANSNKIPCVAVFQINKLVLWGEC